MVEKARTRVIRSVILENGQLKAQPGFGTYRQGFGSLIDFWPQRVGVALSRKGNLPALHSSALAQP